MHIENINWKGNKVKRLSLSDFYMPVLTQDSQSGDKQKADCSFDYIEIWKRMKTDSVNI